jgi:hypothetical protein
MPIEVFVSLTVLVAITMWLAIKHAIGVHQASIQRDILLRGTMCQGRIVAIQRPFLLDDCTRVYFDFQPDGETDAVRGCHIDRRSPDQLQASLPAQGTLVTIRYLPHRPHHAVIGKLIS